MLFSLVALVPLLGAALTSAKPVEKRYTGVYIVSGRNGQCLHSVPRSGSGYPITTQDCNFASTIRWDINPGSGSVLVSGTNYAMDAGSNPGNNGGVKIWQSYPGLYQQTWYLTDDNRIAITGGDQCLDQGDNGPQTYQCTTGNTNQVWYIRSTPLPPASSSSAPPTSSSAAPPPDGPTYGSRLIHPGGRTDLCLSVLGGAVANGYEVSVTGCFDSSSPYTYLQRWDIPAKGQPGLVRLAGKNWCLDAGVNPSSGSKIKIWQCYPGLLQQTWSATGDQTFRLSNGQCLDAVEGAGSIGYRPYASVQPLQTWQCFPGNQNQFFTISFD